MLPVMLFMMDAARLAILGTLNPALLVRADMPVAPGPVFLTVRTGLATLEPARFPVIQRTILDAIMDTLLLCHVALHIGLHALAGHGIRIACLRIMLLGIDVAARAILHALDAALFAIAQMPVFHRIGFGLV